MRSPLLGITRLPLRQKQRFDLRVLGCMIDLSSHGNAGLLTACRARGTCGERQAPGKPARPEARRARYPETGWHAVATRSSADREPHLRTASSVKMRHRSLPDSQSKRPGLKQARELTGSAGDRQVVQLFHTLSSVGWLARLSWIGIGATAVRPALLSSNTISLVALPLPPAVQISAAHDACPRTLDGRRPGAGQTQGRRRPEARSSG